MKKNIFLILFLALASLATGQDYEYDIRQNVADTSKFDLDVITVVNAARQTIQRTLGLDTVGLQTRQYSEAEARYERLARNLRENDNLQRQINTISASLNSLGLNQYIQWQIANNDSIFQGDVTYRDAGGTVLGCYAQNLNDAPTRVRLDSDNTIIATVTFFSRNYIRLNWNTGAGYGNGDSQTFFSSNDGTLYVGYDGTGARHFIRFSNQ